MRAVVVVAAVVVLIAAGGGLAHALWSVSRAPSSVTLQTGDLTVGAEWVDEPVLVDLFPGDSDTGSAVVEVNTDAAWRYRIDTATAGALGEYLRVVWYDDAECSGVARAPGQSNDVTSSGPDTAAFCVRFTLDDQAPSDLQGVDAEVTVIVTAEQVRS